MYAAALTATGIVVCTAAGLATPAYASPITIDGFEFNLNQFKDAYVTVGPGVTEDDVHASHFDNDFGIDPTSDETDQDVPDGYELGELAGRNRGDGKIGAFVGMDGTNRDVGDRITLNGLYVEDGSEEAKSLTLHYGNDPINLSVFSDFVVYEQSSHPDEGEFQETVDKEGKNFRVRFNFSPANVATTRTDWYPANPQSYNDESPVTVSRVFDEEHPGSTQNQIVFSIQALDLNLESNKEIFLQSVELSNLVDLSGIGPNDNDPDFLFAGFATSGSNASEISSVPSPSSVILLLSGLVFGGVFRLRRHHISAAVRTRA